MLDKENQSSQASAAFFEKGLLKTSARKASSLSRRGMNFIAEKNISGLGEVHYRSEDGETVPVSYRKISLWYREAKHGEALSQYNLGVMYFKGAGVFR